MCQMLLCILPRFGWLVHPTKCPGCYEPAAEFVVLVPLGTSVDCQQASAAWHGRTRAGQLGPGPFRGQPQGPHHTRGGRLETRPGGAPGRWTASSNCGPGAFVLAAGSTPVGDASVQLSPARREEIRCWLWNLCRVNGQAIHPRPVPARIDSRMSLMPATRAREPSSRWKDRRFPLHPSSGPCNGRPPRARPTSSSSSKPAARSNS